MTTVPRSPHLLVLSTALLAVAGIALLGMPPGHPPSAPAPPRIAQATTNPSTTPPTPGRKPAVTLAAPTTVAAGTPPVVTSHLPPHGEGVAGDRSIQRSLEAAWPADLPAAEERELLTAGRALLRADATGIGRAKWPTVFPDGSQAVAPAFATARFRIQAAIARREGSPDKAVVHLVWAGLDRGGTFTDCRITDFHFTRTTSTKGTETWTPQSPT
ncbi:hypothetical protein ABZZ74_45300 [Streptomyces sp. NPDC006476]|uniref:hypothetical protein n=1 Tax=Streptomyces sp. NPDC006476 TaxID=3157175 RepID=UPI0033B20F60